MGDDRVLEEHLWDVDTIGGSMLQELVQHYYRSMVFNFGTSSQLIPLFQTTDQWKVGSVPAVFVTNVIVTLECNGSSLDAITRKKVTEVWREVTVWKSLLPHVQWHLTSVETALLFLH